MGREIGLSEDCQWGVMRHLELAGLVFRLQGHLDQVINITALTWHVITDVVIKSLGLQTFAGHLTTPATG